jgi:hypothetical protein
LRREFLCTIDVEAENQIYAHQHQEVANYIPIFRLLSQPSSGRPEKAAVCLSKVVVELTANEGHNIVVWGTTLSNQLPRSL